jgi:hypothetical protein
MSKQLKEFEMQDWIILRLLRHTINGGNFIRMDADRKVDIVNTLGYLSKKYTEKAMLNAVKNL